MAFLPAWAVDGSKVPASMARRESFRASNGRGGITQAMDLEVRELNVPGGAVQIMPGSATLLNDYPGGDGQSYGVANDAAELLSVPATGSGGGATRYVIVRVEDPEFGGQVPPDPLTDPYSYADLVSSTSNLNYPHEVLARIDQPASTATITQGMITDLRRLYNPRIWFENRYYALTTGNTETLSNGPEYFPNAAFQDIYIPEWATEMAIKAVWAGLEYHSGNVYGSCWVTYGPRESTHFRKYKTQNFGWNSTGAGGASRVNWMVLDTRPVPKDIRGTEQFFGTGAKITGGNGDHPQMDWGTGLSIEVTFREVPASDYTP